MSTEPTPTLALIGLAAEYCHLLQNCSDKESSDLIKQLLKYLPRLYMTLGEIKAYPDEETDIAEETGAIESIITEDDYEAIRTSLASVIGENDTYLDTLVEDMKFSDTPIASSISEKLADIYQNLFDLLGTLRNAMPETYPEIISDIKFRFNEYLSENICDALRALNYVYRKAL